VTSKPGSYEIDLKNLPACPLEARVVLVNEHAAVRAQLAVDYIKNRYPRYKKFEESRVFVVWDLLDCMRSDFESLARVWLFPATEASDELSECLNRFLDCSYKSSRDNMRRALELILVGAYFSYSHISLQDAQSWLKSTRGTPLFSRVIKDLSVLPRFALLNAVHKWVVRISRFYWDLCDTIHTKGARHSLRELQPAHARINSIWIPEFNEEALRSSLDMYLQTISHIAVILAAYNPVLLVGLPLFEKFADNPPFSGFFEEHQADALWKLIPEDYHQSFRSIVETDDEALSVIEWINGLPDKL
jgi:hypothetical protein